MLRSVKYKNGITHYLPYMLPAVLAATFVRKMRGNSQAILVEGIDGCLYVVKMSGRLHQSGSLVSELIGNLLCESLGFSVPKSCFVHISDHFLDRYNDAWFHTIDGHIRPPAGVHYGSAFVGMAKGVGRPFNVLNDSENAVYNRSQFCGIHLFDILANHLTRRNYLYVRDLQLNHIHAMFTGNKLLVGASLEPLLVLIPQADCCIQHTINVGWQNTAVLNWINLFKENIPSSLTLALELVPDEWCEVDLGDLERALLQRLDAIEEIVRPFMLEER